MSPAPSAAFRGRAFVATDVLVAGGTIELSTAESHYLVRVRRASVGDRLEVLDGVDRKHAATVVRADPKRCTVTIGSAIDGPAIAPLVVLMGIVDTRAVAEALTGASELGAALVVPVRTARAQAAMPSVERVAKICRAAQRQCGRVRPLAVASVATWPEALDVHPELSGWVACPGAPAPAWEPGEAAGARVFVGPEGGLTDAELDLALHRGNRRLRLGPHIQRTPTAVVSALALLGARGSDPLP